MQRNSENLGLDLVRAGAILAVLVSHTTLWWWADGEAVNVRAAFIGRAGVETFFSLSGFLIGGILLRQGEAGFGFAALGRFWTRRWMRTLPAYWVLLLFLNWWFARSDWPSFVFLQNFRPRELWTPLTPHTWSLVLEEWFYLFVPLLFLAALPAFGRRWAMPAVCMAVIVGCTAGRFLLDPAPHPFWGPEPHLNPIVRLDCAAWGVLAACWVRRAPLSRGRAWALLLAGAGFMLLLGQVWTMAFQPGRLAAWGYQHWHTIYGNDHVAMEEFAAAGIVLGLHRLLPGGPALLAWPVHAAARLSYALYLVHVPVLYLLRGAGYQDVGWLAQAGFGAAILGAALLIRYGVERPVLALRDRLAPDRRPALAIG